MAPASFLVPWFRQVNLTHHGTSSPDDLEHRESEDRTSKPTGSHAMRRNLSAECNGARKVLDLFRCDTSDCSPSGPNATDAHPSRQRST